MPWSSAPPQPVRVFRRAWSSVPVDDAPPREHATVWTGVKQVSAVAAGAVAVLEAPSATSSVLVRMPAGGLDGFPYQFPHEFTTPLGSLVAVAEMPVPHVGVGMGEVAVPTMLASAEAEAPVVESGVVVRLPDGSGGFPHQFPHEFVDPSGSMRAGAAFGAPAVASDVVVAVGLMVAAAELHVGDVASSVLVSAVLMAADAHLTAADAATGVGVTAPVMAAGAAAEAPDGASGAAVAAPAMAAAAELVAPEVEASSAPAVDAPEMVAAAELHAPVPLVVSTVEAPTMRATTVADGFPYQFPFQFTGPLGMHVPEVASGAGVDAPAVSASAAAQVPSVALNVDAAPPAMSATAAPNVPGVSVNVSATVPAMASSASAAAPSAAWTKEPQITPYESSTTVNVTALRNAGYTHLVLVGVGGGEAGTNGGVFTVGTGGDEGSWNSLSIALASYPSLTTLTVTVGNGGGSNGADGGATTITGNGGMPTLTCAGGSGGNGNASGGGPGNYTVDGDTYVGGAERTGTNGAAGNVPGGGGSGGGIFGGSGGAGARGQAWVKAKRV